MTDTGSARRLVFRAVPAVSVAGFAGLCATALLGFEQGNAVLLIGSGLAVLAAPVSVLFDVFMGRSLDREERDRWLARLKGRAVLWAISEYVAEAGGFGGVGSRGAGPPS